MRGWRELAEELPRRATLTAEITNESITLGYVWVGDPDAGRALRPALRSIGVPDREVVRELSYLTLQTRDDSIEGHSYRRYWKGHYLPDLSDGAIVALLDPFAAGVYVNVLSDEAESGVRRAYPEGKHARLTAIKDACDPDNVFHLNHNIPPSGHSSNQQRRPGPRPPTVHGQPVSRLTDPRVLGREDGWRDQR
jgi:hypothetical protein